MQTSNYTGRTNRTMSEAFGPYARGPVHAKPEPMHPADKIIVWIGVVVLITLVALSILKGLA
jgi:hypothetical protein